MTSVLSRRRFIVGSLAAPAIMKHASLARAQSARVYVPGQVTYTIDYQAQTSGAIGGNRTLAYLQDAIDEIADRLDIGPAQPIIHVHRAAPGELATLRPLIGSPRSDDNLPVIEGEPGIVIGQIFAKAVTYPWLIRNIGIAEPGYAAVYCHYGSIIYLQNIIFGTSCMAVQSDYDGSKVEFLQGISTITGHYSNVFYADLGGAIVARTSNGQTASFQRSGATYNNFMSVMTNGVAYFDGAFVAGPSGGNGLYTDGKALLITAPQGGWN